MLSMFIGSIVIAIVCYKVCYSFAFASGFMLPFIIFSILNGIIYFVITQDQTGASGWFFYFIQMPVAFVSFIALVVGANAHDSINEK
ncbi:hypothetical protein [Psychromonas sp.]|uniref:hypothetical protein n=1 Tax=Psychromonas sp. TaxID=1884585 RepID=UPI00356AC035